MIDNLKENSTDIMQFSNSQGKNQYQKTDQKKTALCIRICARVRGCARGFPGHDITKQKLINGNLKRLSNKISLKYIIYSKRPL